MKLSVFLFIAEMFDALSEEKSLLELKCLSRWFAQQSQEGSWLKKIYEDEVDEDLLFAITLSVTLFACGEAANSPEAKKGRIFHLIDSFYQKALEKKPALDGSIDGSMITKAKTIVERILG
ncbi:MAG: hypothetical protein WC385_01015 [Candidatus Paceibacterota bacterium]|jgi:hypothetical protein